MKDLTVMAYETYQKTKSSLEQQKAFYEEFLQEITKEESADIAPHFTCEFDVIKREYVVTLRLPIALNIFHSGGSDLE